ncbi:hypothetical protein P8452_22515 [Trifolium repens]|nr:hypothetical protein P8452_22515 [Trifolium repens]
MHVQIGTFISLLHRVVVKRFLSLRRHGAQMWHGSGPESLWKQENPVTGLEFIRYEFGILASFVGITGAAQVSITGRQSKGTIKYTQCHQGKTILPTNFLHKD